MLTNTKTEEAFAKNMAARIQGRKFKYYSYDKILEFIKRYKDNADRILVGIEEDWNWTAECVWTPQSIRIYDSKELAEKAGDKYAPHREGDIVGIAGIPGSNWGTPTAAVYKGGKIIVEEPVWVIN
jgi:hypothetical protein